MAKKKTVTQETTGTEEVSLAQRQQALDALFNDLSQQYGIVAGRPTVSQAVKDRLTFKFYPSPLPQLNEATGGGIPKGKMTLIAGHPDSGKLIA
jgi:predicted ATP-dependent serine protease